MLNTKHSYQYSQWTHILGIVNVSLYDPLLTGMLSACSFVVSPCLGRMKKVRQEYIFPKSHRVSVTSPLNLTVLPLDSFLKARPRVPFWQLIVGAHFPL